MRERVFFGGQFGGITNVLEGVLLKYLYIQDNNIFFPDKRFDTYKCIHFVPKHKPYTAILLLYRGATIYIRSENNKYRSF